MKIGIYGGTFNPIHAGHTEAARSAAQLLGLKRLLLIPAGTPPHKPLDAQTPSAGARLEMARLAAETIDPICPTEVLDMELRREGKSYTADTIRELKKRFPKDRLFLLMGSDMFLSFHRWRGPGEIARYCTLCAFSRSGRDSQEAFAAQRKLLKKNFHADVAILTLPGMINISSTQLRASLPLGQGKEFLDPAVYGYILREGLYGTAADLKRLPLEDLRYVALSMLRHKRVPHVLGAEDTAAALALRWGADEAAARRAALLHDCTKKLDREQQLALCRQYDIRLGPEDQRTALLHAITGAAVAKHVFGEPPETVSAIRWHTTGKAGMSLLDKIVYLADCIEPTRDYCDLRALRKLAFEDLDQAVLEALAMLAEDLRQRGMEAHTDSVRAREYLKGKRT